MNNRIYYFSGTGNSFALAKDIAVKINANLVSIAAARRGEADNTPADVLGVFFPVYHGGLPLIVRHFLEKMENLENCYIFGVGTYGDSPGLSLKYLAGLLRQRGGHLAAGFGVHMPYNYITPSFSFTNFFGSFSLREIPLPRQQALLAAAQNKADEIAAFVKDRRSGILETDAETITNLVDRFNLKETLGKTVWLRIAGIREQIDLPFAESRQLMDRAFHVDERCNSCGICARICPTGNIHMTEDRPQWHGHCEQCFACLQWCPKEALQFGANTAGGKRYHHPDIKLADMIH